MIMMNTVINNTDQSSYGTALNPFRHGTNAMLQRQLFNDSEITETVRMAAADYLVKYGTNILFLLRTLVF